MMDINTRKIVTRSPHRRVGIIPCPWLQLEPIEYESLLERDFVRLALLSPGLLTIGFQPFKIDLGEFGKYTPDFLLTYRRNVRLVVEVKPREFAESGRYQDLFSEAKKKLAEFGYDFHPVTENEIREDDRHEKAAVLLRYARSNFNPEEILRAMAHARSITDGISISELARRAETTQELVLHLIGRRKLRITNQQLDYSKNSIVNLISGEDDHGNFYPAAWFDSKNRSASF